LYAEGEEPGPPPELSLPNAGQFKVVAWQHQGMGTGSASSLYKSIRLNRENRLSLGTGSAAFNQMLDVAAHRGKQIRLKAHVKAEVRGDGNQALLWLRVDRESGAPGFFDNMSDRPIRSDIWKEYKINGTIDADARSIAFGGLFLGQGKAWMDGFLVEVKAEEGDWARLPIQNSGFEEGELGGRPKNWGTPSQGYSYEITGSAAHEGRASLRVENRYTTLTKPLFEVQPQAGELIRKPLTRDLCCQVPIALYSDEVGTLGETDAGALAALEANLASTLAANPGSETQDLRLGDIIIAWNVFQHFYPYFDQIDVDWDKVLDISLERALEDDTEEDFFLTLNYLVAQLQDGHGNVYSQDSMNKAGPPLGAEWIEDRLVVMASQEPDKFQKGDIILTIDGEEMAQTMRDSEEYISGSLQWKHSKALWRLGYGEIDSTAKIRLLRGDQIIETEFKRTSRMPFKEDKGPNIQELEGGVFYINLDQAPWKDIQARIDDIATAKGVIFDLRGYPNGNHGVISHLLSEKDTSDAWMRIPQIIYPDREQITYRNSGWGIPVQEPHIKGRIVFLTDGRAISYAESFLSFIEHYRLAEIVGQPTAGANGNINPFVLPGGFRLIYTGMRVVKHDGSQHHTIGIQPTVYAERTIQGVRDGRDELIEKALGIIDRE
ncbi:MAG: S41 family peptidase, partial [Candidatus Aminicenantaceae bacterium]